MTERLTLTVPEAADALGCSRAHLYEAIARGQIPVVPHMGRRRLIPKAAIERLVAVPSVEEGSDRRD